MYTNNPNPNRPVPRLRHKTHMHHHSAHAEEEMTLGTKCGFGWLMFLTQILLFGVVGLVLYWTLEYLGGFSWEHKKLVFNWHPVLMIVGFIFMMGQSMLIYRNCRCCKKTYAKLLHTLLHLLVMPAVAVGTVAIFEYHRKNGYKDLYSLHSWLGLGTLGLFSLQFISGFFTYLVFLCCDKATSNFRASTLPNHIHFGLLTFIFAVMTCLTGLTEFALYNRTKGTEKYWNFIPETYIINTLGIAMVVLTVLITYIVRNQSYRRVRILSAS